MAARLAAREGGLELVRAEGDVVVRPEHRLHARAQKSALDAGAAFLIVNAMQRFPSAVELQAVGCRAFRVMWLAAGKNEERGCPWRGNSR